MKKTGVRVTTPLGEVRAARAEKFLIEVNPNDYDPSTLVGVLRQLRTRAAERALRVAARITTKEGYPNRVRNIALDILAKGT